MGTRALFAHTRVAIAVLWQGYTLRPKETYAHSQNAQNIYRRCLGWDLCAVKYLAPHDGRASACEPHSLFARNAAIRTLAKFAPPPPPVDRYESCVCVRMCVGVCVPWLWP